MKKSLIIAVLLLTLTVGWAISSSRATAGSDHQSGIVGAWRVDANGAPYAPHEFVFHSDGTMLTTNPTNVQEDPNEPHGGTNDSVGMGTWELVNDHGHKYVVGTFEQLNAFADDHTEADSLAVTFKLSVDGDEFTGPALAKLGALSGPATLNGERMTIDWDAADDL
jgi:hypothetical protein